MFLVSGTMHFTKRSASTLSNMKAANTGEGSSTLSNVGFADVTRKLHAKLEMAASDWKTSDTRNQALGTTPSWYLQTHSERQRPLLRQDEVGARAARSAGVTALLEEECHRKRSMRLRNSSTRVTRGEDLRRSNNERRKKPALLKKVVASSRLGDVRSTPRL